MSTSQRAVMLCGCGVKVGMAGLQVKQCVAISERFRKSIWYLKALYKCPALLYFALSLTLLALTVILTLTLLVLLNPNF